MFFFSLFVPTNKRIVTSLSYCKVKKKSQVCLCQSWCSWADSNRWRYHQILSVSVSRAWWGLGISFLQEMSRLSAFPKTPPLPLTVQAVQGEEDPHRHQGYPSPGDPRRPHHPLPRPTHQGQRHSPHRPGEQQDHRLHQVWYWYVQLSAQPAGLFPVNEEHLWPLIFLLFQVTCAWWPVVLTWGVSVWSPTGSVTLAPSTWCTSRTAQATALLPGSPTSLSLARWEICHRCLQHTASRPGGCKILGPVRRNVLKVLLLCRVFWSILTVYQSVS